MNKYAVAGGIVVSLAVTVAIWVALLLAGLGVPRGLGGGWATNAALLIGLTQLLYVVPLWLWARHTGNKSFAAGLVIASSLIFILDSACVGWLTSVSGKFPFVP